MKNNRKQMGDLNESLATEFLMKHGFSIIYRNYRKSFGEIDIIAEKHSTIHFIEVKSVSRETLSRGIKPEDHVTREKINKISQTAQFFLSEHELYDTRCQIDLITILSSKEDLDLISSNSNKDNKEALSKLSVSSLIDINYFEKIH
ncbi:YraN family protein [Candidatus Pacebacteria bacterium]|nr:YraN family protein [Candidatus Paceibacterota bacterium]